MFDEHTILTSLQAAVVRSRPEEIHRRFEDDATGRLFNVLERTDEGCDPLDRFHVSEFIPLSSGRVFSGRGEFIDRSDVMAIVGGTPPNEIRAELATVGMDLIDVVRMDSPTWGPYSATFPNLDACAPAIAMALRSNAWYESSRAPTPAEAAHDRAETSDAEARQVTTLKSELLAAQVAIARTRSSDDIFGGCLDAVNPESEAEVCEYLRAPTQDKWLGIRSLVVCAGRTLWNAWADFQHDAPRSGSSGHPGRVVLVDAIRNIPTAQRNLLASRLDELQAVNTEADPEEVVEDEVQAASTCAPGGG